jgi:hypothetical protein
LTNFVVNQLILSEENQEMPSVMPKEVANEIKHNINPRKSPGFDLITSEIVKQLDRYHCCQWSQNYLKNYY